MQHSPLTQHSGRYPMNQAIFRITGSDKLSFLQGQLTNDVSLLSPERALLAGYCDPKGRLLTTLILVISDDDWLMLLPADNADSVIRRLQMFVMRADVQFSVAEDLRCAQQSDTANEAWSCESTSAGITIALPGALQLIIGEDVESQSDHEAALISAGLPEVSAVTSGELLPQSINLDLIGGVSFNKGCYTGQEIVARLHFRGTPARRLYQLSKPAGLALNRGEKILDDNGTAVGMVVRDSADSDILLASLKTKAADSELSNEAGVRLSSPVALGIKPT